MNSIKVKINLEIARRTQNTGRKYEGAHRQGWTGAEWECKAHFVLTKGTWGLTVRGQSRMSTLLSTPT